MFEEMEGSPHLYIDQSLREQIDAGEFDTFIDIGAAEAFLALDLADRMSKLIVVECEERWAEALQATFAPYADKTTIVRKLCTDRTTGNEISLDDLTTGLDLSRAIVKLDVEGYEATVLSGAERALREVKCWLVCTYHKQDDYDRFVALFSKHGYDVTASDGYMLFPDAWKRQRPPYFRKGLIRALRK